MDKAGRLLFGMALVMSVTGSGCATMQAERDAITRYERTREELDRAARGELDRPDYAEAARKKKAPLELSDLAPENWTATFSKLVGREASPQQAETVYRAAQTQYDEAVQLRNQGNAVLATAKFITAADGFTDAAEKWPKSTLEQNGLFFAGESYFFADYYVKAIDSYEKLLKEHPNSRHLDDVQKRRFAIAQFWLDTYNEERPSFYEVNLTDESQPWQGMFTRSMKVFDRIRLDDPTGKLADDATLAMANAHFAEGQFIKADEYYTDLRKTFPSSEHQFTAHFVGLKSKLLCYQGSEYSGAVLDESEKLIDTIRRQFPIEAEREREYLVRAKAEVRFRKAEREWQMAEYFHRKAEFGAAKFYYAIILREYGDTSFAERTRERIVEIGGLPDVPAQRFEWLVDLFPREDKVRPLIATDKPKTKKR